VSWVGIVLVGCGPVHLGDEIPESFRDGAQGSDAAVAADARLTPEADESAPDAGARRTPLDVSITVTPPDCDGCYQLEARAVGGESPFEFEWEDGSREAERRVCASGPPLDVSVLAEDARGQRSTSALLRLLASETTCPPPPEKLCLGNPSFEGRPTPNLGLPNNFDAFPWSACTNPAASNTPEIVNDTIPQLIVTPIQATDGLTYVAMTDGEQVSQTLCREIAGGTTLNLRLDVARVNLDAVSTPTGTLALEIWGGVGADCSRRELIWASPPIETGWQTLCAALKPAQYMDRLLLRTIVDRAPTGATYLLVDHLLPVDTCS
jgi:hypothetical protein